MAVEIPTWIYKSEGDKQTASEMNQLAQAVIANATELSNTKDDVADFDNRLTAIEVSGAIEKVEEDVSLEENAILSKYSKKAQQYKHTFKKDANGNYYWVSTEPIN